MSVQNKKRLESAMMTHKGVSRENNDDKVYGSSELGLWLLSDGVGGLKQGEQASLYTVKEIRKSVANGANLLNAVHSAHSVIKAYNRHEEEDRGATVVALHSRGDNYDVAWVGDSRAYLWNEVTGELNQLTEDHTLVQKLLNAGLLEPSQVKHHPKRHVITQCLGIENDNQLDIGFFSREWDYGEHVLLASDGLYDELSRTELIGALRLQRDNQAKVEYMVSLACQNGGSDNVSVILLSSPVQKPKKKQKKSFIDQVKELLKIS